MDNNTAKEFDNFFEKMGGDAKLAGARRNVELVEKQGYVGFRKVEAADIYRSQHPDWICKLEDGEYRFYPPEKDIYMDMINTFKEVNHNFHGMVRAQVNVLEDGEKCKYSLKTIDKATGNETLIQENIVDFNGQFLYKVLPSIYYAMSNGLPVDDSQRGPYVYFDSLDKSRLLQFGNLTPEQIRLVYDMRDFVDKQLGLYVSEDTKGRF